MSLTIEEQKKYKIIIPAYEPEENLLTFVASLQQELSSEIIIVDDGSGDAYRHIFKKLQENYGCKILTHYVNMGKGRALKDAFNYCLNTYSDLKGCVTADSDGQHTPKDIARCMEKLYQNPDRLILGARDFSGEDIPFKSKYGNKITTFVVKLFCGMKISDTQTGLRAIPASFMSQILTTPGERFEYEMNMLLTWAREKKGIREIDIRTVYLNDNASSHFDTVKDSWRVYKEILRFSASSLVGFAVDYILFCLLSLLTGRVLVSNIVARVCSASVNYTLNRRMVFAEKAPVARSLPRYAALAVMILACNTLILKLLTMLGVTAWLAKLATEMLLFAVSFLAQKKLVFTGEVRHENA